MGRTASAFRLTRERIGRYLHLVNSRERRTAQAGLHIHEARHRTLNSPGGFSRGRLSDARHTMASSFQIITAKPSGDPPEDFAQELTDLGDCACLHAADDELVHRVGVVKLMRETEKVASTWQNYFLCIGNASHHLARGL